MIDTYLQAIRMALGFKEFIAALGWVMVFAMIVGGVLDEDFRSIWRWLFAGGVYVLFQELARSSILDRMAAPNHAIAVMTSVIIFVIYSAGITLGWFIVYLAKKRVRDQFSREVQRQEVEMEDERQRLDEQEKNETYPEEQQEGQEEGE